MANDVRPISVPPCLGFSSVRVISAIVVTADTIDNIADGTVAAIDGGLLTTDGEVQ